MNESNSDNLAKVIRQQRQRIAELEAQVDRESVDAPLRAESPYAADVRRLGWIFAGGLAMGAILLWLALERALWLLFPAQALCAFSFMMLLVWAADTFGLRSVNLVEELKKGNTAYALVFASVVLFGGLVVLALAIGGITR
jgi:hypothetical protein